MKKIPTLFERDFDGNRQVIDKVHSGCEWVQAGECVPTQKLDGTCCMICDGVLYRRHEVKPGCEPPIGFEPCGDVDENTGKIQGWVVVGDGPQDKYHREAFDSTLPDGTYELLGPKIQGNPEGYASHRLVRHGSIKFDCDVPTDFDGLREWLTLHNCMEGIVWHHPDGRMAKIKLRDFGIKRKGN